MSACPYAELSYLIVEDSATMRGWLRAAIADAGGKHIDTAESYFDALFRIRNRGGYNVVLCDYILSDTRDGQQLLEEVRRTHLLPKSTIWLMITGERSYEQVFSAAELAPDDYLIKPITAALLQERFARAWSQQQALKAANDLFDAGEFESAYQRCRSDTLTHPQYALQFLRLMGDCLMRLEHFREAHDHYESILVDRPRLPWAKLGKARAFFHLERYDESQEILGELMEATPDFLHAHDLMAKVHERKGDLLATKDLLKTVLQKNPKALNRHREVVRVAMATKDTDTAIEAFALMHQHGKGSSFLKAGDFCAYAGMLMNAQGKAASDRLDALTGNLRDFHRSDPAFSFAEKMVNFAAARRADDAAAGREAYGQMRSALATAAADGRVVESEQNMAMLEAALSMKDEVTALSVAQDLFSDYFGNESMTRRIEGLMESGGMADKSSELAGKAVERLKELNRAAIELAKQGKILEAVEEFASLADSNRNIAVVLNAATAIVKYLEDVIERGKSFEPARRRRLENRLEGYLNFVRERDPGNVRMEKIETAYRALRSAVTESGSSAGLRTGSA